MPTLLIILAVYLSCQALEAFLSIINLSHLRRHGSEVPAALAETITSEKLNQTRNYTVENNIVSLCATFCKITTTVLFLFTPLLNWYNNWLTNLGLPFLVTAVLFFLMLVHIEAIIQIPFDLYRTFRIEQRYGFNTQTLALWFADTIKGLLLSTILISLLLGAIFWLMTATPNFWWLTSWLFILCFTITILYLSPSLIEPLFNTFTPIDNPALEQKLQEVLKKAGLQISRVFSMDASKRSKHSNAYFSGIGRVKRIVLFDTMTANHTPDEIVAILAHEAGHWKKKHITKRLLLIQTMTLLGLFIAHQLIKSELPATLFALEQPTLYGQLLLVSFLGGLATWPLTPLLNLLSRAHEREADRYAVELTGSSAPLAAALVKMSKDNLSNLHPHPWYAAFHYSHPALLTRIATLRQQETHAKQG